MACIIAFNVPVQLGRAFILLNTFLKLYSDIFWRLNNDFILCLWRNIFWTQLRYTFMKIKLEPARSLVQDKYLPLRRFQTCHVHSLITDALTVLGSILRSIRKQNRCIRGEGGGVCHQFFEPLVKGGSFNFRLLMGCWSSYSSLNKRPNA